MRSISRGISIPVWHRGHICLLVTRVTSEHVGQRVNVPFGLIVTMIHRPYIK